MDAERTHGQASVASIGESIDYGTPKQRNSLQWTITMRKVGQPCSTNCVQYNTKPIILILHRTIQYDAMKCNYNFYTTMQCSAMHQHTISSMASHSRPYRFQNLPPH